MSALPFIPSTSLIPTNQVPQDQNYLDLRIIRFQTDEKARNSYSNRQYAFQHDAGQFNVVKAVLTRKGITNNPKFVRIVAVMHPTLKAFVDLIRYDPANPPKENFAAHEMEQAHLQTQSDFKGQKAQNKELFKTYILEGSRGNRPLYLPAIAGWQSKKSFEKTIFVAFDESELDAMYGDLYLPKDPIMQADGQTQTSALFAVADSKDAIEFEILNNLRVTLEVELNVDARKAGQSFADRNGRGSKKNKNLVIALDTSSALSEMREEAIANTAFQNRIADGRTAGVSTTATRNIADLSTVEQMILAVIFGNYREKPERLKHHHIAALLPYVKGFFQLLDETFSLQWLEKTPSNTDSYRQLYVHGWGFAQKALATAYHHVLRDKLEPIVESMRVRPEGGQTQNEAFEAAIASYDTSKSKQPEVSLEEFKQRLSQIDWLRYRKHWIKITGARQKDGKNAPANLKSAPNVVAALAPNTPAIIGVVTDKLLSDSWKELTSKVDEKL
jgi:hypothetical protein